MKLIICLTMVMMSCRAVLFAGSLDQLGSVSGADRAAIKTELPRSERVDTFETRKDEMKALIGSLLMHPEKYTADQLGYLIVNIDALLGSMARSSPERDEFNALRDAVSRELDNRVGGGRPAALTLEQLKAEAREKAGAVLKSPGSFTLGEIGGVLSKLDVVRSCLPKASSVRAEFDARREAVNKVFEAHP